MGSETWSPPSSETWSPLSYETWSPPSSETRSPLSSETWSPPSCEARSPDEQRHQKPTLLSPPRSRGFLVTLHVSCHTIVKLLKLLNKFIRTLGMMLVSRFVNMVSLTHL